MYLQPLLGIVEYIIFTSVAEFICAQSPYSMKGVLMGIFFVVLAFSVVLSFGLLEVIKRYVKCGIWLHSGITGASIVGVVIQIFTTKFYKFRKRDDILNNEQMFAEKI